MFSFREFIKRGFLNAVGKLPDYRIILNAAGWLDKGVLLQEDLEAIQDAIDARDAAQIPDAAPIGGTLSEETPGDGTLSEETPANGTPSEETPGDGTPSQETPGDGTLSEETPGDGTPSQETPGDGTLSAGETEEDENAASA